MTLEEKDVYIVQHLMKLQPDTLRFMVADLTAEVEKLTIRNTKLEKDLAGELDLSVRLNEGWVNLNKRIYENEIALSRAEGRREGMQEAARIAETLIATRSYRSVGVHIAAAIREAAQDKEGE